MDVTDDAQGPLDPRIQIELENLNTATDDINKLEIELDEAKTSFNHWQSESLKKLLDIKNKIGAGYVEKARCYYDADKLAGQAQLQIEHQTRLFKRANEIHDTAKETVALAEARFISHKHEWNFDQAWQDMLNHATIQVRDAYDKKAIYERELNMKIRLYQDATKKAQQLKEKYRQAIIRARPFFDQQDYDEQEILMQKAKISCLEKAIKDAKRAYSRSFRALEEISNEIHQQRRDYVMMVNGPREPGVGAELISPAESLNYEKELNNVTGDRMNSLASGSSDIDERERDIADIMELKERMENIGGRSVDGSESTSNQWELELQASLEKLNTLTNKNSNWNSPIRSENSLSILKLNSDSLNNCQSDFKNNSPMMDQRKQQNYNLSKKLPVNFQLMKKIGLNNDENIGNNQGSQSLTQSPINSILNRSRMAIKNSLSKSLTNSPINIGFKSGKSNIINNLLSVDSHDATISVNNSTINNISSLKNNQKDSNNANDNNELTVPINESKTVYNSNEQEISCDRINDENGNCSNDSGILGNSECKSISVHETHDNCLLEKNCEIKFVDNAKFKEASCKISSIKELPLLSIFERSNKLKISKDKSCSMINLAEKQNLKSRFDNSAMGNIQAVSVERLANARHILMAEHADTKLKLSNKK
ncbi:hypothetical protein PV327_009351 [Microctonus hyperodae]|uniref:SH3 domain-binding protein 5-like protein n=1 Tax=Microctonus hyperodae TaxID=165561 RepID=A0AA39FU26_MICHY|nr:hypothetical protein PV327_009351 [Microctonus hyperodae]